MSIEIFLEESFKNLTNFLKRYFVTVWILIRKRDLNTKHILKPLSFYIVSYTIYILSIKYIPISNIYSTAYQSLSDEVPINNFVPLIIKDINIINIIANFLPAYFYVIISSYLFSFIFGIRFKFSRIVSNGFFYVFGLSLFFITVGVLLIKLTISLGIPFKLSGSSSSLSELAIQVIPTFFILCILFFGTFRCIFVTEEVINISQDNLNMIGKFIHKYKDYFSIFIAACTFFLLIGQAKMTVSLFGESGISVKCKVDNIKIKENSIKFMLLISNTSNETIYFDKSKVIINIDLLPAFERYAKKNNLGYALMNDDELMTKFHVSSKQEDKRIFIGQIAPPVATFDFKADMKIELQSDNTKLKIINPNETKWIEAILIVDKYKIYNHKKKAYEEKNSSDDFQIDISFMIKYKTFDTEGITMSKKNSIIL